MGDPSNSLSFCLLADYPDAVPVVARWYFDTWGFADPVNSPSATEARIRGKLTRDHLPCHVVAVRGGTVVGVAQLKFQEMSTYPANTVWLGGVVVSPEQRGRGIGSALCEEATRRGFRLGHRELYLQTESLDGGMYRRLGWVVLEHVNYRGVDVAVMLRRLIAEPGAAADPAS